MFNFKDAVSNILIEQDQPAANAVSQTITNDAQNIMVSKGFQELRNAYTAQYGKTLDVNEILKAVNIIIGGKYIAAKYTNLGYIPFIDAFAQVYAQINDKNKSNFTQSDIINLIVQDPATFDPIFNKIAANLKDTTNVQEYEPNNPDVNRAWRSLTAETNKLSQTAMQSLGSDTVHSAITKIIAKRVPVLDRIMGLKGLVRPFNTSVITPILYQFKKYTGYRQGDFKKNPSGWLRDRAWPKKVSGDFSKMVDDISASNLLNVAILAYEYYVYLLSTQGQQVKQPINASLNLFDAFIENLLNEAPLQTTAEIAMQRAGTAAATDRAATRARILKNIGQTRAGTKSSKYKETTPQQQTQQSTGLTPEQVDKISDTIGSAPTPDYTSFIDNGESQYLPGTKYNLSTISKDPSREAQALYKALTNMAYFVRTSVGTKERLQALGSLGSNIAAFGGAKLYG